MPLITVTMHNMPTYHKLTLKLNCSTNTRIVVYRTYIIGLSPAGDMFRELLMGEMLRIRRKQL